MTRKIRCLTVDDEPLAREGLSRYISRIEWLSLAGECENAMQLDSRLRSNDMVDLVFLDIEMPVISGLDYLATLDNPPMVILITAYGQYALRGYDLNVVDYLLKPVSFPRFLKAATKARDYFSLRSAETQREFMFLRADKKLIKVVFADILYIEAVENYVKIVTRTGALLTRMPLRSILDRLPADNFLRVHKSYIVNMDCVSCIEGNMLTLPGAVIQASRSCKELLTAWIESH